MAKTRTRPVEQGTERDEDHDGERNRPEKALEIGLEETFLASDAVAVIAPKPSPGGERTPALISGQSLKEKHHAEYSNAKRTDERSHRSRPQNERAADRGHRLSAGRYRAGRGAAIQGDVRDCRRSSWRPRYRLPAL